MCESAVSLLTVIGVGVPGDEGSNVTSCPASSTAACTGSSTGTRWLCSVALASESIDAGWSCPVTRG